MCERNERVPRDDLKIKIARLFRTTVQEIFFNYKEVITMMQEKETAESRQES